MLYVSNRIMMVSHAIILFVCTLNLSHHSFLLTFYFLSSSSGSLTRSTACCSSLRSQFFCIRNRLSCCRARYHKYLILSFVTAGYFLFFILQSLLRISLYFISIWRSITMGLGVFWKKEKIDVFVSSRYSSIKNFQYLFFVTLTLSAFLFMIDDGRPCLLIMFSMKRAYVRPILYSN